MLYYKYSFIAEEPINGGVNMPISDLRNYIEVLREVDNRNSVYHTGNGQDAYTIMTVAEVDELERIRAARALAEDLRRAEERANREGWIDADNFEREMGI